MPTGPSWEERRQDIILFVRQVYARFTEDRVPLAAGAITFYLLLTMVPVTLLVMSLAAYLLKSSRDAQVIIDEMAKIWAPDIANAFTHQVLVIVQHRGLSLFIALVLGLMAGSQIFLVLESAMNVTWHSPRKRPFLARRVLALLMVIIVGLLLGLAVILTNVIRFFAHLPIMPFIIHGHAISLFANILVSFLIPTLLVAAIFGLIYIELPTRRITIRSIVPGALIAAVLWEITLHIFGWYMTNAIGRFTIIYGSLGGLVLFMLWLYYSAQIFMLGAEVSYVYHQRLISAGDEEEQKVAIEP